MHVQVLQDLPDFSFNPTSVENLVVDFTAFYGVKFDEASINFVDTPTICKLHEEFFADPTTTDCISFPMDDACDEGYRVFGDVFVCPETAKEYVKGNGGDLYREITLYIIHGLLHLLGYDDIDDEDQKKMRAEEERYLKHVDTQSLWITKNPSK